MHQFLGASNIESIVNQYLDHFVIFRYIDAFFEYSNITILGILGEAHLDKVSRRIGTRDEACTACPILVHRPLANLTVLGDLVGIYGQNVLARCEDGCSCQGHDCSQGLADLIHIAAAVRLLLPRLSNAFYSPRDAHSEMRGLTSSVTSMPSAACLKVITSQKSK